MPSKSSNHSKGDTSNTPVREDGAPTTEAGETDLSATGTESTMVDEAGGDEKSVSASSQEAAGSADAAGVAEVSAGGSADDMDAGDQTQVGSTVSEAADAAGSPASDAPADLSEAPQDTTSDASDEIDQRTNEGENQMSEVTDEGRSGLSEVADQVRTAASSVAAAASDKAQDVVSGMSDELEQVITERKDQGAQRLHGLAEAITRASGEIEEEFPRVADYVKRGASKLDTLADTIREQDSRTLATQASDVVRQRAGTVAALLGLVGFATVRFLMATPPRSSAAGNSDGEHDATGTSEVVQEALERLNTTDEGLGSGDPGGISPAAPGFEKTSDTGEATSGAL